MGGHQLVPDQDDIDLDDPGSVRPCLGDRRDRRTGIVPNAERVTVVGQRLYGRVAVEIDRLVAEDLLFSDRRPETGADNHQHQR